MRVNLSRTRRQPSCVGSTQVDLELRGRQQRIKVTREVEKIIVIKQNYIVPARSIKVLGLETAVILISDKTSNSVAQVFRYWMMTRTLRADG